MAREIYALTTATKETLTAGVKAIAYAWNKCERYVYQILAEEKNDCFAIFLSLYKAVLKAGVSTAAWDAELEHERSRYAANRTPKELVERLSLSVKTHNTRLEFCMEAMSDGVWTLAEIEQAERLVIAVMDADKLMLSALKFRKQKLTS